MLRNGIFEINKVLPFITPHDRKFTKGYVGDDSIIYAVKMASHRYHCFSKRGTSCVKCGLKGEFFALESHHYNSGARRFHFNLYGFKGDKEVMLTKDHIIPKSKGGKNHISNYQTMCITCNHKKGNKMVDT